MLLFSIRESIKIRQAQSKSGKSDQIEIKIAPITKTDTPTTKQAGSKCTTFKEAGCKR